MILLAFAADRVFGDPKRFHPVAGFGRVAAALERRLWADSRSRGALYAGALVLWATLGSRSLERAAERLAAALERGDLAEARRLAPTLVGRDPSQLDAAELARAAVESVAENTSDAVVAPLLWATVFGAPGAAAYRAVNTLDAMVGHKDARHLRFGWAAARLDDVANWPAARLTALLAAAVGGRPRAALAAARRARHPSPNAGVVEAAFAGTLGLRLGGTNRYRHGIEHRPTLGTGRPPEPADVARAVTLSRRISFVAAALLQVASCCKAGRSRA